MIPGGLGQNPVSFECSAPDNFLIYGSVFNIKVKYGGFSMNICELYEILEDLFKEIKIKLWLSFDSSDTYQATAHNLVFFMDPKKLKQDDSSKFTE